MYGDLGISKELIDLSVNLSQPMLTKFGVFRALKPFLNDFDTISIQLDVLVI